MQFQGVACFYIHVRLKKVSYKLKGRRNDNGSINFRIPKIRDYTSKKRHPISFNEFDKKAIRLATICSKHS